MACHCPLPPQDALLLEIENQSLYVLWEKFIASKAEEMSKGVGKDVVADNTELKKQLHHHQPGLELFVNCLLRLNVLFFYRIEMSPMTMASRS